MNATDNGREARSRAARRLRKLTIGTAALGVAATGGFGWLAAVTYSGSTTAATAAFTVPSTPPGGRHDIRGVGHDGHRADRGRRAGQRPCIHRRLLR